MKKIKLEYIILITIIFVSALYLIFKQTDKINYSLPTLKKISITDIYKIEIKKDNSKIVLLKKNEDWKVGDKLYSGSKTAIDKILKDISALNLITLVSKRKNYNLYELDSPKSFEIKTFNKNNKLIRHFFIGKTASTYDHTYVRLANNPNVYQAEGSIRDDFDKNIDDFRDKTVLSINKNSITSLKVKKGGKEFTINKVPVNFDEKSDKNKKNKFRKNIKFEWKLEDNKLSNDKMDTLLNRFTSLDCSAFIYDKEEIINATPIYTIEINADRKYFLKIFDRKDKDKREYPAISSGIEYPFFLNAYTAEEIMKNPEDFIVK